MPLRHCEQSWEGGKSRLVSPDTGLKVSVREMCGRHIGTLSNGIAVYVLRTHIS
jgi:hypothetical protein